MLGTRARLGQGRLILVNPSAFVRSILEVTQLDRWFEICDNLEEAANRLA
jgi:anti-anti-sigma regulatory factor